MRSLGRAVLSLVIAAAVSAALLWGGDLLTQQMLIEHTTNKVYTIYSQLLNADTFEPITAVTGNVTEAWTALDERGAAVGYAVTASVEGYAGRIEVHTAFSADGTTVKGVRIGSHQETPGYGARIAEAQFTNQFASRRAPFTRQEGQSGTLRDGQYRAAETTYDSSGFRYFVELTVAGGEITAINWDAEQQNGGKTKKELSRDGEYVMSETGLPWHEQAEILELVLLDVQDPARIVYQPDTGKTDAYSGATITISPFVTLAAEALGKARNTDGTAVEGVSGATISSRAVIAAVNEAAEFVAALAQ